MLKDKRLSEFVGIMLGDGYLSYPKNPRIKISFNSKDDIEYFIFVKDFLEKLFEAKVVAEYRKTENTANLYIFKRSLIRKLLDEVGLIPSPKWNRAKIPEWIIEKKLETHFLRGFFDTDGCLVRTNNNGITYPRLEIKVCPSPMQSQFIDILNKFEFRFGVYPIGSGKVRVQLNGKKQLLRWNQLVGFHNIKHREKCDFFLK